MEIVLRGVQRAEEFALSAAGAGAAGASSTAAWVEALFRVHYPRLTSMLARLTGDRGQAEEIAADVFQKLAQRPEMLENCQRDGQSGPTAWIYRVATNAGFDALRANARRRKREEAGGVSGDALESKAARHAPENALDQLLREERRARVRAVLGAMKPRDAQLLLLRSGGLAYREVAQTLGIQPGSVGTLLARAEAEFERRFRARYGDEI